MIKIKGATMNKPVGAIYDKYFGKDKEKINIATKKDKITTEDSKQIVHKLVTIKTKTAKAERKFKIRSNGVLRISGKYIVDKFGFKALQEVTIENPIAGTIIIKGKD